VIVPRSLSEFGVQRFGIEYDRRLAAYLRSRYALTQRVGGPAFPVFVLRRTTSG